MVVAPTGMTAVAPTTATIGTVTALAPNLLASLIGPSNLFAPSTHHLVSSLTNPSHDHLRFRVHAQPLCPAHHLQCAVVVVAVVAGAKQKPA